MSATKEKRSSTRTKAPIPPALFAHYVIKTKQMDRMVKWYEAVLGAHIVFRSDFICFMTYDHEHHRVAFIQLPQDVELQPGGSIDHVAYAYRDLGELLANYYRLKEQGIEPVRMINHGPTISFYYRDPDRVMLELQVDNFSTAEESTAFFHSDEFRENPIGTWVDPDKLRADWEAGVPWEEIRKRPPMPAGMSIMDMRKERPQ